MARFQKTPITGILKYHDRVSLSAPPARYHDWVMKEFRILGMRLTSAVTTLIS